MPIYFEFCSSNNDSMKNRFLILIGLLLSLQSFAQIGINTTTPNAMLDISSTTNGFLIPRIALTANNVAAPVVNPQGGALPTSTLIYNTSTVAGINGVAPGYYYWNGSLWVSFSSSIDWKLNGNSSITTPAFPITYGTSTIGASENFIGTIDANDVVMGSNNIERFRIRAGSGFVGIGTSNPAYNLHINKSTAGSITTFSENTFVGNTNGTAIFGSSFNNPGYGIGGQFAGGSRGVIAQANGSTSTFTVTGVLASATGSGNGFREGGNFSASGVNISNKGIVSDANGATTSNYGGLFSASGGVESYGGLFSAFGGTSNYGGYFSVISPATTNYAGYFSASTGTKNYAIVVPSTGGTVGFGTITPNALLDVSSSTNGVLFPRIALTANNVASPVVNPQGGALPTSTLIYNTATVAGINGVSPGYYYWSGTLWIPFLSPISNDWKLNGNTAITTPAIPATYGTSAISPTENFIGTKDANDVVIGTNNIERLRIDKSTGNVGIGTANPNYSLHVINKNAGAVTTFSQNAYTGNTDGYGLLGVALNNPGFGVGGAFTGGYIGVMGTNPADTYSGDSYGGYFLSLGTLGRKFGVYAEAQNGTTNYGGYFSATGGTNNYAIVVPSNSGDVGIGTITPTHKLHVTNSVSNAPTAYFVNGSNSGLGIEAIASGIFGGTGGRFTGSTVGVRGTVGSTLGATTIYGGIFSATSLSSDSYGVQATASGAVNANYAGYFTSTGTTTNVAGYFSTSNGATVYDNKAIIVPPNGGLVGIGTNNPVDQLEVAGGYVRSTGYRCRTGTAGVYPGNTFNINWTGTTAQLWIDTFNIGTFQFTSDRRLKENILKMNDTALSRVLQLKPVSYNYKNIPNTIFTGSDVVTEGFIADELQEVIPSAVNGDKNAVASDGTIQPQTINTAPIVSVLTKAIQEQQQIINELKIKNNQLEVRLKAIEERFGK